MFKGTGEKTEQYKKKKCKNNVENVEGENEKKK